eukprot:Selendium_serpulae@DN2397_c0_g1_i1.p2
MNQSVEAHSGPTAVRTVGRSMWQHVVVRASGARCRSAAVGRVAAPLGRLVARRRRQRRGADVAVGEIWVWRVFTYSLRCSLAPIARQRCVAVLRVERGVLEVPC